MTHQENTLNIKKLFAEFSCKKSRAQAKSMGAVKLWADHLSVAVLFQGCKWCKMLIALSFLHRALEWSVLQHKDCDLAFYVVCLGRVNPFVLRICQQRLELRM